MISIQDKFNNTFYLQQQIKKAPAFSTYTSSCQTPFVKPSSENFKAYALSFTSSTKDKSYQDNFEFIDEIVKKVKGKEYQGQGLFKKDENGRYTDYIDWEKVGWQNLKKEPVDWEKTRKIDWENSDEREPFKKEVFTFWHALALAETKESTWTRRFNPFNNHEPLATFRSIVSPQAKIRFKYLSKALDKIKGKESEMLDQHVINSKTGNIVFSFTVFDTETTGVNTVSKRPIIPKTKEEGKDTEAPIDKIIQIGGVKFEEGKINPDSALSQLINPERHIPEGATAIHGITDKDVGDKPPIESVLKPFNNDYLNGDLLVAYNSKFDITLLNHSLTNYNESNSPELKLKKMSMTIDPFILIQRIHPHLGVKKKLSEQYKFLFGKDLEGAHDAFADVKATVDVLKYSLYYLNDHLTPDAKKKGEQITVRDLLKFQCGEVPEKIDLKLGKSGYNEDRTYKQSYRLLMTGVDDFFNGYSITEPTNRRKELKNVIEELQPLIGIENINIIRRGGLVNSVIDDTADGYKINPQETSGDPKKGMINREYLMKDNFKNVLLNIGVKGFKDLTRNQVIDVITEHSKNYIKEDYIDLWMKNPNPYETFSKGNDLPDIKIARKVMLERSASDNSTNIKACDLQEVFNRIKSDPANKKLNFKDFKKTYNQTEEAIGDIDSPPKKAKK